MSGLDADEFVALVVLFGLLVVLLSAAGVGATGSSGPSASVDLDPTYSEDPCQATIDVYLGDGDEQVDRVVVEVDQRGERSRVIGTGQDRTLDVARQKFDMTIERGAPIRIYAIAFDGEAKLLVDDRVTNFCTLAEGSA